MQYLRWQGEMRFVKSLPVDRQGAGKVGSQGPDRAEHSSVAFVRYKEAARTLTAAVEAVVAVVAVPETAVAGSLVAHSLGIGWAVR